MRVLAGNGYPQPNGRTTPPAERFTLINGRPETIALKFSTGKQVQSRFGGPQIMYTLSDGRRAYFDPEVAAEIDSLRLAPGQPFSICKTGPNWDINYSYPASGNGALCTQYAPQPAAQQPAHPQHVPLQNPPQPRVNGAGEDAGSILERSYARAIEITVAAVEIARSKGLTFLPTHEGLQACAATLFIAETRRLDK